MTDRLREIGRALWWLVVFVGGLVALFVAAEIVVAVLFGIALVNGLREWAGGQWR